MNCTEIWNNYDEITANRIRSDKQNVIIESQEELNYFIDDALNNDNNKALHLGKIDENIIDQIKKKIKNIPKNKNDFLNKKTYDLIINQSEIRHLTDYKSSLIVAMIKLYIARIPDIIINSEFVSYSSNGKYEGLRFRKFFEDGTYISFVITSNKGTMKFQTVYMIKGDYEKAKK